MTRETPEPGRGDTAGLRLRDLVNQLAPANASLDWFFDWPPDLFALTWMILQRTGIHRHVVEPGSTWPPEVDWAAGLQREGDAWLGHLCLEGRPLGKRVARWRRDLEGALDTRLADLQDCVDPSARDVVPLWPLCEAILGLHAAADVTCSGFALPQGANDAFVPDVRATSGPEQGRAMDEDEAELAQDLRELRFFASLLLVLTGSLSRVHTQCAIVLPKMRTPGSGLTVRSLSHQLTVHTTEVRVEWRAMPWVNVDEDMANVLIVPLPYRVEPTWFIQIGRAHV